MGGGVKRRVEEGVKRGGWNEGGEEWRRGGVKRGG